MRTEELSDEHMKQQARFLGLPEPTAEECAWLRGFCLWMRARYAPDTLRPADLEALRQGRPIQPAKA